MNHTGTPLIDEVGSLLEGGITDVFDTMLGLNVHVLFPDEPCAEDEFYVAASVGFVGNVNGIVYIYLTPELARMLAGRLLNIDESEAGDDELVGDSVGELSNMIVGAVKSRLCDLGLACNLTIPSIVRGRGLNAGPVLSSESLRLAIVCNDHLIQVQLIMLPTPFMLPTS